MPKLMHIIRMRGITSLIFVILFRLHLADITRLGKLAEFFRLNAKIDGIRIRLDGPNIETPVRGILMLGGYETPERTLAKRYLPPDEPVVELGASLGVVSCVVNRHLSHPSRQIVVEANGDLLPYLKANRDANHCSFAIEHAAIAYGVDHVVFYANEGSLGGSAHRQAGNPVSVPAKSLQTIFANSGFANFNLICDIEGSEIDLIANELSLLQQHVGWMIIEFHDAISGQRAIEQAFSQLHGIGFELVEYIQGTYCFKNTTNALEATMKRPVIRTGSI